MSWKMKANKVLLINPKQSVAKGSIRRLPTHLGLMYIASVLERAGHNVHILDSPCEGYDQVYETDGLEFYGINDEKLALIIRDAKPDFVGVSCLFSKQLDEVRRTCKIVKQAYPQAMTVVGGMYPSLFAGEILASSPEIDYIIQKEGESRLLNLVNNPENPESHDGLAYRKRGKVIVNPALFVEDVSKLPMPARHLVDLKRYIKIGLFSNPFSRKEMIEQVLCSRGCAFRCDFCSTPRFWGNYRRRNARDILREIIYLRDAYGVEEIQFRDDNLTIDRENALRLFQSMKGLGIVWCSGAMIQSLDAEIIKSMAESGCYKLTLSPESGSERVLRELMKKPLNLSRVKPVFDLCHEYNISIHSDFIIGYPGETLEEINRTFDFAREIGSDSASFFLAGPNPGSPLYDRAAANGWLEGGWRGDYKSSGIHMKPGDPEYVMPANDLETLVEKKTREHNEWAKTRNPVGWDNKYRVFLKKHPELAGMIMGRVV